MKNPSNALRMAYIKALKGNLTVNGTVVPVYKKILPAALPSVYVFLSTETGRKERSTSNNLREHTILIDVVSKFGSFEGGNEIVDSLQEQISEIVDAGTELDLSPWGFKCILTEEEDSHDVDMQTPTETIIRKLIRYRHLIQKV